ncbi:MAG: hypothetical protein Q9210_003408 [Variospora velana]
MLNLPAELWHLTCAYIDRSSLFTIRLVCHKLSTIATPYLFRELYINWLPQSISHIAAVAAHPILRHHVRCLVFELSLLDPRLKDFEYWQSSCDLEDTIERVRKGIYTEVYGCTLRYMDKIGPRDLPLSETDKKDLHAPMVNRLNDQKRLLNDPQTQESLANILSSLTALESLKTIKSAEYVHGFDSSAYEDRSPTLLDQEDEDFERWETLARCQRADSLMCKPFMATRLAFPGLASLSSTLIARAIDLAAPKLKTFNITAWPADVEDMATAWPPGKCLQSAKRASVRSMTLHLLKHSSRSPTASELSAIGSFIHNAVFLTHIQLELPPHKWASDDSWPNNPFNRYFCPDVSWDISGMMDKICLPYLKSLQLHRFCISEKSFISIMKHHAHTLRRAVFYLPHMRSPSDHDAMPFSSWRRAITEIAPLVSLSYVDLGLFEDAWLSSKLRHVEFLAAQGLWSRFWVTRHATYVDYCRQVSAYLQCQGHIEYPKFETYMVQILERCEEGSHEAIFGMTLSSLEFYRKEVQGRATSYQWSH